MAAPTVYKSTDASAPTLDGQKGSLITVLKKCLVEGYGAKTGAGWTIAVEDAPNNKIIFRNNSGTGSGRYFRVQDNGRVASGATSYHTSDRACNAAICGMHSYSDINTPVQPFPRVIAGGNLHNSYAYGVTVRKRYSPSNPTYAAPWMVIADDRTCYLVTTTESGNTTTLSTLSDGTKQRGITAFGDVRSFNPSNSALPQAFVLGQAVLGYLDVYTGGNYEGNPTLDMPIPQIAGIWVDKGIQNTNYGTKGMVRGMRFNNFDSTWKWYGGNCKPDAAEGTFVRYPSAENFGFVATPIMVLDDPTDVINVNNSGSGWATEHGILPGLYHCPHTTSPNSTYRVGDELSTVTFGGKTYLLLSLFMDNDITTYSYLLAFNTGDWWA